MWLSKTISPLLNPIFLGQHFMIYCLLVSSTTISISEFSFRQLTRFTLMFVSTLPSPSLIMMALYLPKMQNLQNYINYFSAIDRVEISVYALNNDYIFAIYHSLSIALSISYLVYYCQRLIFRHCQTVMMVLGQMGYGAISPKFFNKI